MLPTIPIDLRSDTVTRPSPDMRRAMADAVVGDDVFMEDPTLNALQRRAAEVFDREAALFVPSGSMGNLTCVLAQTRPGQEVICETNGHVYNYEMGALSAVGGVLPRVVDGENGLLSWEVIAKAIRPKVYYRPQTALICLENTVNMAGGTVLPTSRAKDICDRAHAQGIHVHLDGARVFNAATYLNERVADMTRPFDSVQFCLSKGLGAPVGSMIVGTRDFIEHCRSIRKMLGGGMRQAGVLAAAGLVALEHGPKRLQDDHDNAKVLANRLADIEGVTLDPQSVQTNIIIFSLKDSGVSSAELLQRLAERKVLAVPVDGERIRMVTHLDVTRQDVEAAADVVRSAMMR
ncbi:MAG: aminotransferase class I/II-fold pyridoxal phosphate-dependent enzyme [Vicinamibacterales bacterium]|nr:aminotransferase class I/II-fold pyridoxal phosphate-dependent enzyme [Vicinamibacterales bacterium]